MSSLTWKAKYKNPKARKKPAVTVCGTESCTALIETAIAQSCREEEEQPVLDSLYSTAINDFCSAEKRLCNGLPIARPPRYFVLVCFKEIVSQVFSRANDGTAQCQAG
jgi:hypothetical protein